MEEHQTEGESTIPDENKQALAELLRDWMEANNVCCLTTVMKTTEAGIQFEMQWDHPENAEWEEATHDQH